MMKPISAQRLNTDLLRRLLYVNWYCHCELYCKNGKLAPFKWSYSSASKLYFGKFLVAKTHLTAFEIFKIYGVLSQTPIAIRSTITRTHPIPIAIRRPFITASTFPLFLYDEILVQLKQFNGNGNLGTEGVHVIKQWHNLRNYSSLKFVRKFRCRVGLLQHGREPTLRSTLSSRS